MHIHIVIQIALDSKTTNLSTATPFLQSMRAFEIFHIKWYNIFERLTNEMTTVHSCYSFCSEREKGILVSIHMSVLLLGKLNYGETV